MEDCVSGAVWKMATRQTKLSVADRQHLRLDVVDAEQSGQ